MNAGCIGVQRSQFVTRQQVVQRLYRIRLMVSNSNTKLSFFCGWQLVEEELQRIPPHIARRHGKQLWSIVYIPQVRCLHFA